LGTDSYPEGDGISFTKRHLKGGEEGKPVSNGGVGGRGKTKKLEYGNSSGRALRKKACKNKYKWGGSKEDREHCANDKRSKALKKMVQLGRLALGF